MNLMTKLFGASSAFQSTHLPYQTLTATEYSEQFGQKNAAHALIDVRTPAEFAAGHIAAAKNIPLQELQLRLSEIPRDKPIVLYCRTGNRSGQAAYLLSQTGMEDVYNAGGLGELAKAGLPVNVPAMNSSLNL